MFAFAAHLYQCIAVCVCVCVCVVHVIFYGSKGSTSLLYGTRRRVKVSADCEAAARGEYQQRKPPVNEKHLLHVDVREGPPALTS